MNENLLVCTEMNGKVKKIKLKPPTKEIDWHFPHAEKIKGARNPKQSDLT